MIGVHEFETEKAGSVIGVFCDVVCILSEILAGASNELITDYLRESHARF